MAMTRPKNATHNTIFTSFEPKAHRYGTNKIRYSGTPIPVLVGRQRFQVPVAWGLDASEDCPDGDVPVGSCKMGQRVKSVIPRSVIEAENGAFAERPETCTAAFQAWFEYLLDSAREK